MGDAAIKQYFGEDVLGALIIFIGAQMDTVCLLYKMYKHSSKYDYTIALLTLVCISPLSCLKSNICMVCTYV